jgi:hypothetical protein
MSAVSSFAPYTTSPARATAGSTDGFTGASPQRILCENWAASGQAMGVGLDMRPAWTVGFSTACKELTPYPPQEFRSNYSDKPKGGMQWTIRWTGLYTGETAYRNQ